MIIDASNLILGRIGTVAAKRALLGEKVDIINCEKAIVTGDKRYILAKYKARRLRRQINKGPFIPRRPDMFVRRMVRGMLPYKQEKGKEAFERVMCYLGVPEQFKGKNIETIEKADVRKIPNLKYTTVETICKEMGWK